ncbi:MAG: hypothetical protein ACOCUV_00495, partial [bacterium]
NLFYDIHAGTAIRVYNLGTDFFVINNTVIGHIRTENEYSYGAGKMYGSISIHTISSDYDGSGLHVYNNILIGLSSLPSTAHVVGNLMWSYYPSEDSWNFRCELSGNIILTCSEYYPINYLTDSLFISDTLIFDSRHGQQLDFHIYEESEAVKLGEPDLQTSYGLAELNLEGFIEGKGHIRNRTFHSAGCYEIGDMQNKLMKPKSLRLEH